MRSVSQHERDQRFRDASIDLAVVATPNDSHFAIASTFLTAGISVVCEKPLTSDSESAAELVRLAEERGLVLAVPHCYSAYAMVRHAAPADARHGHLGAIRSLPPSTRRGGTLRLSNWVGHKQAIWRTDPKIAGRASVVGDLGTHAYQLLRYITGLDAQQVSARMDTLVPGRRVFDNATVTARLTGDVACHDLGEHGGNRPQSRATYPRLRRLNEASNGSTRTHTISRCKTSPARPAS